MGGRAKTEGESLAADKWMIKSCVWGVIICNEKLAKTM